MICLLLCFFGAIVGIWASWKLYVMWMNRDVIILIVRQKLIFGALVTLPEVKVIFRFWIYLNGLRLKKNKNTGKGKKQFNLDNEDQPE